MLDRNVHHFRNDSEPIPSDDEPALTSAEIKVAERLLKKNENCLKKLMTYIEQHTVLGFNSQKYDIPLIRPYLHRVSSS